MKNLNNQGKRRNNVPVVDVIAEHLEQIISDQKQQEKEIVDFNVIFNKKIDILMKKMVDVKSKLRIRKPSTIRRVNLNTGSTSKTVKNILISTLKDSRAVHKEAVYESKNNEEEEEGTESEESEESEDDNEQVEKQVD